VEMLGGPFGLSAAQPHMPPLRMVAGRAWQPYHVTMVYFVVVDALYSNRFQWEEAVMYGAECRRRQYSDVWY